MCYYRAGLWAETQGKEIHLVLLYRIGYWVRMSNLYATANKVNVNQRNMKLKYILNAILFVLALSFLSMCIFKTTELSLKCMQFAGHTAAPADAVEDVLTEVEYICQKKGGQGAVREYAEYLIRMFV